MILYKTEHLLLDVGINLVSHADSREGKVGLPEFLSTFGPD